MNDTILPKPPPAVIMAAGRGNRLLPLTHDRPKCLLEVGGVSLLLHQIQALVAGGVRRIQVVIGHGGALVRQACATLAGEPAMEGVALDFAVNEYYATTSSLYSLGCATLEPGPEGLLLLNSDVLFHPELLRRLIADPRPQVLLADFEGARRGALGEEEMKIMADDAGRIQAISKQLDPAGAQAENIGVLKVGRDAARRMLELARLPAEEAEGLCWVPDAINALCAGIEFHALPTGELPWIEIDYPHDLRRAREEVWPLLAEACKPPAAGVRPGPGERDCQR